jgi:hypothetical protein
MSQEQAQYAPPQPTQEHTKLQELAGTWNVDCEFYMDPSQPPMQVQGKETVEAFGQFWIQSVFECEMFGAPFRGGVIGGVEGLLRKSCRVAEDGLQHARRISEMTGQPLDGVLAQEKILDQKTFGACLKRHTESVVFKAMDWKDGDFFFDKTPAPVFANPVALKVDDLILEGTRRSDEWVLIQQKIPNFTMVFEPLIGNDGYCVGGAITMADVFLVPEVYAARRFKVDLEPFERIRRVEERCNGLTAFQLAHPSRQPDAAF